MKIDILLPSNINQTKPARNHRLFALFAVVLLSLKLIMSSGGLIADTLFTNPNEVRYIIATLGAICAFGCFYSARRLWLKNLNAA